MDLPSILRDPKNGLGNLYKPNYKYCALTKRHDGALIMQRLNQGWEMILDDVTGTASSEEFVLLGKPDETV